MLYYAVEIARKRCRHYAARHACRRHMRASVMEYYMLTCAFADICRRHAAAAAAMSLAAIRYYYCFFRAPYSAMPCAMLPFFCRLIRTATQSGTAVIAAVAA